MVERICRVLHSILLTTMFFYSLLFLFNSSLLFYPPFYFINYYICVIIRLVPTNLLRIFLIIIDLSCYVAQFYCVGLKKGKQSYTIFFAVVALLDLLFCIMLSLEMGETFYILEMLKRLSISLIFNSVVLFSSMYIYCNNQ